MLSPSEVLEMVPQKPPFRFLDRLLEISAEGAIGEYCFRADESFYAGHFPGDPVTPGVILIEAMCQTGLVALGIYLLGLEAPKEQVEKAITLFTEAESEFFAVVRPGERVQIQAKKLYWRRRKLKSECQILRDNTLVARATVAGVGLLREQLSVAQSTPLTGEPG